MAAVRLIRLGPVCSDAVDAIAKAIRTELGWALEIDASAVDPSFAFVPARGQYYSSVLLQRIEGMISGDERAILGVTEADLFIPILTFVFGEALLRRPAAVVSLHRLDTRFYGLPEDRGLLLRRAQVESVHELGHTLGLIHCPDYACVMHASRAAEEIDLKGPGFCGECAKTLRSANLGMRR